jgi:Zn finger protein HypA/HybF involved in hydrogenase expression
MRNFFAQILVFLISAFLIIQFTSCINEKKEPDLIYISKSNVFVTLDDVKDGIRKTQNSMPPVFFSHNEHEKKNILCIECHHKKNNDSRLKKCASCHKGIQGTEALHGFCILCHEKREDGPKTCQGCHREEKKNIVPIKSKMDYKSEGIYRDPFHPVHKKNKITCVECHHKEKTTAVIMRKCPECHSGESRLQIIHAFCKECHDGTKKAPVVCKGCHKK